MKISILTLFPEMFCGPFESSIIKKACEKKLVEINLINIRDFGIGKHESVDDTPYGGGIGMVMRADVLSKAIMHTKKAFSQQFNNLTMKQSIILLSASGRKYTQSKAKEFSKLDHIILVCGRYEGVDERIKDYITEEISVGDCVYTGGEIPAMLITDSVTRLIPGVLKQSATDNESFSLTNSKGITFLEYPQYTKPAVFDNQSVPKILLSGNHKKINAWRMREANKKTKKIRPDLLKLK